MRDRGTQGYSSSLCLRGITVGDDEEIVLCTPVPLLHRDRTLLEARGLLSSLIPARAFAGRPLSRVKSARWLGKMPADGFGDFGERGL